MWMRIVRSNSKDVHIEQQRHLFCSLLFMQQIHRADLFLEEILSRFSGSPLLLLRARFKTSCGFTDLIAYRRWDNTEPVSGLFCL
jgi:hypothetical protein